MNLFSSPDETRQVVVEYNIQHLNKFYSIQLDAKENSYGN